MKKYILTILAIILIAGIAFVSLSNGKTKTVKEGGVLSVNDIQADPSAYKGAITITGVVADKSRFKVPANVFLMVETSEAKICKQTGCARFYLPVKLEGVIPKEWDEVNVTGSFAEGAGLLFVATKVEVLRHLTFK
ncbi:MAG TPA: hypothetical protein DD713_06235 [Nitrospiraceae bacterium]|nr:hypothetical protein [Nitrospiraceae bacterium]